MKRTASSTQHTGPIPLTGEMGRPMIVGLTGGIGSGKSTIARALASRGFTVYDCDQEAKHIIAEDKEVQQRIIALLGKESFRKGEYNTSYVAQRVFAEKELLEQLNGIVHPAVKADIKKRFAQSPKMKAESLFIESAILYEAGLDEICDKVVVVEAPEDVCIARTIARDYGGVITADHIKKVRARMRAQKVVNCQPSASSQQLIIQNDGRTSVSDLAEEIVRFCGV